MHPHAPDERLSLLLEPMQASTVIATAEIHTPNNEPTKKATKPAKIPADVSITTAPTIFSVKPGALGLG